MYNSYSSRRRKKQRAKKARSLYEEALYTLETSASKGMGDYLYIMKMQGTYGQAQTDTPALPTDPIWMPEGTSGFKKDFNEVQKKISAVAKREKKSRSSTEKHKARIPYSTQRFTDF
jgi:hypothetical protein